MRIAIIGGGLTGLTAAYYLNKKNYAVTVFEKENTVGGLASGFKEARWDWCLDKTYHHIFSSDCDILNLSGEIGFNGFEFKKPETASLYSNNLIAQLDTPFDLLNFPLLSLPEKLRAGIIIAFLKLSPHFSLYEQQTAEQFLKKTMGNRAWIVLWEELFRKKFGKYAENILASFIWARVKKRTKSLGYPKGGFQEFINNLVTYIENKGVTVKSRTPVDAICPKGGGYELSIQNNTPGLFDVVISTIPTPFFLSITKNVGFPDSYIAGLKMRSYLHSISIIISSSEKLLDSTYWLSICDKKIPLTVCVQHTNYIDKKHYGNKHIVYVGNYIEKTNPLWLMDNVSLRHNIEPYLKKINPSFSIESFHVFRAPYSQPIFNNAFIRSGLTFETPLKGMYSANLDMTYPYDRGTNYAVLLGKQISTVI